MSFVLTKNNVDYTLYLVTDQTILSGKSLEEDVEQAIFGGCSIVQIREKDTDGRVFFETAKRLREMPAKCSIPLIINDRVDIAMAVGADGVHLGQKDLPCKEVRALLGNDRLIGVSAATVAEAIQAERDGADYLGVGAMHVTATKQNTRPVTPSLLAEITGSVSIPVVAIGGISGENVNELQHTGIHGVAVVSAVLGKPDILEAAHTLRSQVEAITHVF